MFRESEKFFDSGELSLEQTLAVLCQRKNRPSSITDQVWSRILEGAPYNNDELVELRDAVVESMDEAIGCLTYGWSGYGPAHSGAISVAIWAGLFIMRSSDIDDKGPFLTIADVLDLEYFWAEGVPGGELSYDAAVVPDETIRSIGLAMCGEEGGTVVINDVNYIRQDDALHEVS
jgi:hypothetical protein